MSGRSNRHLLFAVAGATAALADHCDQLTDRLLTQESKVADVVSVLGEELTRLRTEVEGVRRLMAESPPPSND